MSFALPKMFHLFQSNVRVLFAFGNNGILCQCCLYWKSGYAETRIIRILLKHAMCKCMQADTARTIAQADAVLVGFLIPDQAFNLEVSLRKYRGNN